MPSRACKTRYRGFGNQEKHEELYLQVVAGSRFLQTGSPQPLCGLEGKQMLLCSCGLPCVLFRMTTWCSALHDSPIFFLWARSVAAL